MLRSIPVGHDPDRPLERTELSAADNLPRFPKQRIRPLIEHQRKHPAAFLRCLAKCPRTRQADIHRLFNQHMPACVQCLNRHLAVQRMRNGNHSRLRRTGGKQFILA